MTLERRSRFAPLLARLAVPLASGLLAACAVGDNHGDPEYSMLGGGGDRVNSAAAHQMLGPEFERLDLVRLLDPLGDIPPNARANAACEALTDKGQQFRDGCLIDNAFMQYHAAAARDTPAHRNSIQDRILAASDQRCNVFLAYLQRHQSATNFTLGSVTTVLAGAGAIATGVGVARALAGTAGMVSGVRAEFDQSYFQNQTTSIISKGIRKRRDDIRESIDAQRAKGVADYTVERAIGDALHYHGACSIVAGLEEADTTLSQSAGLDVLRDNLQRAVAIRTLASQVNAAPAAASAVTP